MKSIRNTFSAKLRRINLTIVVVGLLWVFSSVAQANDSRTPSPGPTDPLWPCVGAEPWVYTLWNDDGSVKAGYPKERPATVVCKPPYRVGPWKETSFNGVGFFDKCNKNTRHTNENPLAVMNALIDDVREFNACLYQADHEYRVTYNISPLYQWGEACVEPSENAALIYPYYTRLDKPTFAPDLYGMYFYIGHLRFPPSLPYCGGKAGDTSYEPSDSDVILALYECPTNTNAVNKPVGEGTCVPVVPPEPPEPEESNSDDEQECPKMVGHPVDVSSGHQIERVIDYLGKNNLSFSRYYSSGSPAFGNTLPWGSTAEYSSILSIKKAGTLRYSTFAVLSQNSSQLVYNLQDDNSLTPIIGTTQSKLALITQTTPTPNSLVMDSVPSGTPIYITGFTLTNRDGGVDQFDYLGTLVSRTSPNNSVLFFNFSGTGDARNLATISDFTGRSLGFSYNTRNQLTQMTDPAGGLYTYDYNVDATNRGNSLLNKVTYPNGTSIQYTYDFVTRNLTSIIDQKGAIYNTMSYSVTDPSKSVSSQLIGGVDGYTFAYTPYGGTYQDPDILVVDITDSLGITTHRQYTKINGLRRLTAQDQPAGSGCQAAVSYAAYTDTGRRSSVDDFNGGRTCYISSVADAARNLDTSIIEGLSKTTACGATLANYSFSGVVRATTTQWHPDVALPAKVAKPKQLTQLIYNGQPDPSNGNTLASCMPGTLPNGKAPLVLCKKIVNATTDSTGATGLNAVFDTTVTTKVSSFTYNANGQVLTSKDPGGAVTQFAYYNSTSVEPGAEHSKGDLASIVNPKGQITTFDAYNAHGDLLRSTAINGLVTTMTYDAMRRMLTASAGGLTETYTYEPFGAVATVTAPNGGLTTYTYDAAHRLVTVTDASGNVHSKTLDTADGVISETVQDSRGAIARNVTRVYDALRRVQQVTGVQ